MKNNDKALIQLIGQTVTVIIDRPLGSFHPRYNDTQYLVNYGFIEGMIAPDGMEQDAYILGIQVPLDIFTGEVIAVIIRNDDLENKLVIGPAGFRFTEEEIEKQVAFQEKYFATKIICKK